MAQSIEFLIEFILTLTPTILLLFFVAFIYFRGKGKNKKIVLKTINNLQEYFSPIATEFVEVNKSNAGYTYGLTLKKPSDDEKDPLRYIRRLRIHFSLEDRQNFIAFFKLLIKKPKDYFIIEGDSVIRNDHLKLEIADNSSFGRWDLEKIQEEWEDLVDFEPQSQFTTKFFHKTNYPKALKQLYDNEPDLKKLLFNLNGLYRVSIKRKEDWGFRIALVIHTKDKKQFAIAREIALRILRGLNEINVAISKQPKRYIG
jgi:hypothetical protein